MKADTTLKTFAASSVSRSQVKEEISKIAEKISKKKDPDAEGTEEKKDKEDKKDKKAEEKKKEPKQMELL